MCWKIKNGMRSLLRLDISLLFFSTRSARAKAHVSKVSYKRRIDNSEAFFFVGQ